jgi:hypothetical protein
VPRASVWAIVRGLAIVDHHAWAGHPDIGDAPPASRLLGGVTILLRLFFADGFERLALAGPIMASAYRLGLGVPFLVRDACCRKER